MFYKLRSRPTWIAAVGMCLLFGSAALGVRAQSLNQEFEFANKLAEGGFPDFANKLMESIVRKYPDQAGRAKIISAKSLIAARKYADAEAIIKEMAAGDPNADSIRLALANGYYRSGDMDRARQIYQEFFARFQQPPTDPDLLKFYSDAAYRFAQMLRLSGDLGGAAEALGRVISATADKEQVRSLLAEQAQLLVDRALQLSGDERNQYLERAEKICKDIQWGGADLWFGQSIVTLANIELARGNRDLAKKMLTQQYADILGEIDDLIKQEKVSTAMSPLAGSRFLLGKIYQEDASAALQDPNRRDEAIGLLGSALKEFYNVFVKYGESDWGPPAGVRANEIKAQLEGMGKTVNIDLGAKQAEKASATQFRLADNLFRQKQFGEAIRQYLLALNAYPETPASIRSLGFLLQSYVETDNLLYARAVAEYIAERFAGNADAAAALLSNASVVSGKQNESFALELYDLYLSHFPKHERAGTILYYLGSVRRKAGDIEGSDHYFQRIVDEYPKDQNYPKALRLIARSYYDLKQYDKAREAYARLVSDVPPSPDRANAQFSLADSYVRQTNWSAAATEFEKLIGWLAPKGNPYAATEEDRAKNMSVLERAIFQRANAYSRMTGTVEQVASYRERGMRGYQQFLQLFPQSEFAPRAMMGQGQVQLGLNQFDEATKTFDELAAKYPNSEEGRNALFSLASSAMEIGQYDQARMAFEKMSANKDKYSPSEFARIGQLMIDAKLFDQALEAFRFVANNPQIQATKDLPESRTLLERALYGVGRAYFEQKNNEGAIKALDALLRDYPRTALFFEARFLLCEAYAETGNFRAASESLNEIFRFSKDPVQLNQASMKLAEVQLKANDKSGALASFQRVALLSDPNKVEQRPFIQEALLAGMPLAMELGHFKDLVDSCELYLKLFPTSDKVAEVRRLRSEASLRASTNGGATPSTGP